MRWFWQRRKKEGASPGAMRTEEAQGRVKRVTSPRPVVLSGPLATALEPRDELLAFARDLLNARGARVRVEEDDLVIATFSTSAPARYTTTLARARVEEETTLLTQGAPALETLFEEAAHRARFTTAVLARNVEPAALAMRALAPLPAACGRCAGNGHERWQAGMPGCDACPLRHDALALRWESRPVSARVVRWEDEPGVELTYRISGRDRRGRRDEWLRLAFSSQYGARVPALTLDQIATAQASDAALPDNSASGAAMDHAREKLQPGLDALSAYLAQRVSDEFLRRVEDVTTTHERLKRERPEEALTISAALERELASLADVYGIEVEASLEAVCYITSPVALVAIETELGSGPTVSVDAGRGVARPPTCAGCGANAVAGRVCAHGHVYCSDCVEACARCDAMRCPACGAPPLAPCGLCGDLTCDACARACDSCGGRFCADHIWACIEGDLSLCLRDLILCGECQSPLCQSHATSCSVCDEALCPRHARICKTGGEALCATHSTACGSCHQPLCAAHTARCENCGQGTCGDDIFTCPGCGRALCACSAPSPCASCGASYCARCHDGGATCPACRNLSPASETDLEPLRLAAVREPAISPKRSWLTGRNALARVYVSRSLGREEAYLISEQGDIIATHRKGWLAR